MKLKRIRKGLGLIGIVGMCIASFGNGVVLAYPSQGIPLYLDATDDGNNDSQIDPGKDSGTDKDPKPKPTPSEGDDEEKDKGNDKDKDDDNGKDKDPGDKSGGDKNKKPTPSIPDPVIINPILPVPPVPIEEEYDPVKNDDKKNKKNPVVRTKQIEEKEEESIVEVIEIESGPIEEIEEATEPEIEEFNKSDNEFEEEIVEEEPERNKNILKAIAALTAAVAVAVGSGGAIFFFIIYVKRPGLTGFYETEGLSVKYKDTYGKDKDLEYMVSADEIAAKCSNTEEFIYGLRDSGMRTILPAFSKVYVTVIYEDGDQTSIKVKPSDNNIYNAIEEFVDAGNVVEIQITNLRGNKRLKPVVFNRY